MTGLRLGGGRNGIQSEYMPMEMYGVPSTPEDYVNLGNGIGAPDSTFGSQNWLTSSPEAFGGNSFSSYGAGSSALTNKSGLFASPLQQRNADGSTYGGYLGAGLGIVQGLGSAYMGMKQYGLAKDQLAFQKSAYNKNYAAQRQSTNTDMADRQAARVAANSSYESVGSYMDKNRIA